MPKILVLGRNGQVGWELERCLAGVGRVIALGRAEFDLSRPDAIRRRIEIEEPAVIINAAAYTDVDGAESDRELARTVNSLAPQILAKAARAQGSLLIHYSTDYVFGGEKGSPYTEDDPTAPLNTYGRTKLDGEEAIASEGGTYWIFRTSWVYSTRRACFVTKLLAWARTQRTIQIAEDQWGSPTWCRVIAEATRRATQLSLARGQEWTLSTAGTYHVACTGAPSRLDWAKAIIELDPHSEEQQTREVIGVPATRFPSPAQRPPYSALDSTRFRSTFGWILPTWGQALGQALQRG